MKDATYISVLLDRSGSMAAVKDDTIGGFNQFLKDQKQAGDNCNLSLVQFDSVSVDTVHENAPIKDVPELNDSTYVPRGGTPLLDALGEAIDKTGKVLAGIPEHNRPDKVVFVIITDGQENASKTFTKAKVKEAIEHQANAYKWRFVYLGANQDAFHEAGSLGISQATTSNYATRNTKAAFTAVSANLVAARTTRDLSKLDYSDEQRTQLQK